MASFCANCGGAVETGTRFCGTCGSAVEVRTAPPVSIAPPSSPVSPTGRARRYPALRVISVILQILAALTVFGGAIAGLSAASTTSSLPSYPGISVPGAGLAGAAIGWIIFLASVCYALFLWASAEMIHVLIDIEENTRLGATRG